MKTFTLRINGENVFDAALSLLYPRFDSLTFLQEEWRRDEGPPVLRVEVVTNDGAAVIAAAELIRARLDQLGVGIEYAGRCYRCGAEDPATELQEQLAREVALAR
jgi:hypothetical protein